jgi:hypothetical protein
MTAVFPLNSIRDSIKGYMGRIGQKVRSTVNNQRKKADRDKEKKQLLENKMKLIETDEPGQEANDSGKFSVQQEKTETSPDMYLDVPKIKAEEIKLTLEELDARVALQAELARMVRINVGVTAGIKKLDLDIKGLDLNALLKVKLKNVKRIFNRVLESIDKNPDLLKDLDEASQAGSAVNAGSFVNEKRRSPEPGTRKEDEQGRKSAVSHFEGKEENHEETDFDNKSLIFRDQQKNDNLDERGNTQDAHNRIFKEKMSDKTYEEVEKKKNGVEKITKVVLSPELANCGDIETSVASIKQTTEGRSSIRKNGVFRLFRLNR